MGFLGALLRRSMDVRHPACPSWSTLLVAGFLLAAAGCDPGADQSAALTSPSCLLHATSPAPTSNTEGMVFVSGTSFMQGAAAVHPEEGPPRLTVVGDFWIDQTEVTNAAFARFVEATGYVTLAERPLDPTAYPGLTDDQLEPSGIVFVQGEMQLRGQMDWWQVVPGANWKQPEGPGSSIASREHHPVVQIAYDDALAYARWLGRDLPTEAEWELAARGGLEGARYTWGNQPLDSQQPQANVWQGPFPAIDEGTDGYKAKTAPVGCFPANGFGLYDIAGNVWEWTRDWYSPNLDPSDNYHPRGPSEHRVPLSPRTHEKSHVVKGGSFLCADNYCLRYRPPAREAGPTDTGSSHIGFRTILRQSAVSPSGS